MAALTIGAFTQQDVIATLSDDSASYLTLARLGHFAGNLSNYPPAFPLLLALTGGAYDFRIAYALIAACASGALVVTYFFVALERGPRVALAVVVLFLLTPTAWVTLKGVMSEAPYLLAAMACLLCHEKRVHPLWFGLLVAVAYLTRTIGLALILGYAVHLAIRSWSARRRPQAREFLAFVPVVVLAALWYLLRPYADTDIYRRLSSSVSSWWAGDFAGTFVAAVQFFFYGWLRSFMSDHYVSLTAQVVFAVVGLLSVAGLAMRLARNRLDAWFTLFSLGAVFVWTFSADASSRLMYPFVPLLIFYAIESVTAALARWDVAPARRMQAAALAAILPLLVSFPALALVMQKGLDRRAVIAGCGYEYRHIRDYYTILNQGSAEELARLQGAMLCGLQALRVVTPADAVVAWMRPEYVELVGDRRGFAYLYRWSPKEAAAQMRQGNVSYVLDTDFFKNDLEGGRGRPIEGMRLDEYTKPVFVTGNGVFVVRQVERAALDRFLAAD